eukprot:2582288-Alexandrium_andersonii.AAC.1
MVRARSADIVSTWRLATHGAARTPAQSFVEPKASPQHCMGCGAPGPTRKEPCPGDAARSIGE